MAKAGWVFCPNNGSNAPDLPVGVAGHYTNPMEIYRITGGPVGFEHTHVLFGSHALASLDRVGQTDAAHYHWVVYYAGAWQQATVGAQSHTHDLNIDANGNLTPDWFLIFWQGSNADAVLIDADANCVIAVQAAISVDPDTGEDVAGALSTVAWNGATRTLWETRMASVLALELPVEITNGDRLIAWLCGALVSRPNQREQWLRR